MAKKSGDKESKKGTKREKADLKLIEKLLKSQGTVRAINILRDNQHLIDAELVERMEMVAMMLGEKGDREAVQFLMDIAEGLTEEFGLDNELGVFHKFVRQMMAAVIKNKGNPEAVYRILHAYQQQDTKFIEHFYNWIVTEIEEADSEKGLGLAVIMSIWDNVIWEFPVGDRESRSRS